MTAQPVESWGPLAFKQFYQEGLKASPAFKAALAAFYESHTDIASWQSPLQDHSQYCGFGPLVYRTAPAAIEADLLPATNPNNPVDVFMLCNTICRMEWIEPDDNLPNVIGLHTPAVKMFAALAKKPELADTVLGATAESVMTRTTHKTRIKHLDFVPDVLRDFDRNFADFM